MNYLDGKREKMYQAGLLKIAMKMRLDEDIRGFDEIFREILRDMDLDPEELLLAHTHPEELFPQHADHSDPHYQRHHI